MTMKTPEQIAHQVYREGITLPTNPNGADLRALMVAAIEADRAQHDLLYARQVIDRNDGRAVIWSREDIETVLDERIEDSRVERPVTPDEYRGIVDRAMGSACWRGLEECSDRDWELIGLALDDAMGGEA